MSQNDGGQAFPTPGDSHTLGEEGMTLRDWFAGQALAGRHLGCNKLTPSHAVAESAYEVADAMIAERDKKKEEAPK